MPWAVSTDGTLTHSGTSGDAYILPGLFGQGYAFEVDLLSTSHYVGLVVLATEDARSGWMAGVFDDTSADSTKLSLRRITEGTIETVQTGGDAPNDATPVAHGLSANTPFTLRIEVVDGRLVASMRGALVSGTVQIAYLNDTAPTFLTNTRIAVWSKTNNARVIAVRAIPAVYRTSDERAIAYWSTGGDVWACYDGVTAELIARNAVPISDPLATASMNGLGFFAGGGVIKVFDPQARTVVPFVPTAGQLPGTRGGGSFDVIGVADFKARVYWAMRAGVIASAVGDPFDVDTGALEDGSAFDLRASNRQDFGDDIVSIIKANDDTLIFGTTTGIYGMFGDPVDGQIRQLPITLDAGPSSWYSVLPIDASGRCVAHTSAGLLVFSTVEGGGNFSRGIIREGLNTPEGKIGRIEVTCVRDPARAYLWTFITNRAVMPGLSSLPDAGQHWVYDESAGGYQGGNPAFFPISFASSRLDPTRAISWRGKVLLGCADGQVRVFDDDAGRDCVAAGSYLPVDAKCEFGVVDAPGVLAGVMLNWIRPELSTTSGAVRATVYGADGVAELFDQSRRVMIWNGDLFDGEVMLTSQRANAISVKVAAGSLNTGANASRWSVEQVEADIDGVPAHRQFSRSPSTTLSSVVRPTRAIPAPAGPTPPDPFQECGATVNGDEDVVPSGVISTVTYGATTSTGQFVQPTVTLTNVTGTLTYDWSVDGLSVWTSLDNSATPPSIELPSGTRTLRVVVTGGSLRAPLTITRTIFVSKTGGTGSQDVPGDGADTDTPTDTSVEKPVSQFVGGIYEAAPVESGSCSISTGTPPAPPAGYGGGTYASGGFL